MKAKEISSIIEEYAPLSIQEEWDNSGFCIGNGESEVHKLLIGFDCTEELVEEALELGADMIVTHHPLIFGGIKHISSSSMTGRTIIEAIKHDIVVYACHTNMDKVLGGVSGKLASKLGLMDVEILDENPAGYGLGIVGNLPESVPTDIFISRVKEILSLKSIKTSRPVENIKRVALCGGSGHSLIGKAEESGADVYISGDISYHNFFCADNFMIMDIGHFESEVHIMETIYNILHEKIPNFAIFIGKKVINPVSYF